MPNEAAPGVLYQCRKAILMSSHSRKRPSWFETIRAYLNGLRIRSLARQGYGVVVVGPCNTGKTFMLGKAFPGKVVQPDRQLMDAAHRPPLDVTTLPDGLCAVDEVSYYDWQKTRPSFPDLRERKVVFAVQSVGKVLDAGLADLFQERLQIVFLGTRDQLREQCRLTPLLFQRTVLGLGPQRD